MISSENYYTSRISDFESEEQADDFTALASSVDIVSHEKIFQFLINNEVILFFFILICHFFEHMKQVRVLAMYITKYLYWSFKLDEGLLILKDLLNFLNEELNHLDW